MSTAIYSFRGTEAPLSALTRVWAETRGADLGRSSEQSLAIFMLGSDALARMARLELARRAALEEP